MAADQFKLPAAVAGHVSVTTYSDGVRVSFGESHDGKEENILWRTAVFLPNTVFASTIDLFIKIRQQMLEQKQNEASARKDN